MNSTFENFLTKSGISKETVFKLLDAEYEYHQYYLRRLHGYNMFTIERGITHDVFQMQYNL